MDRNRGNIALYAWLYGITGILPFVLSTKLNDPVYYPQLLGLTLLLLLIGGWYALGQIRKKAIPPFPKLPRVAAIALGGFVLLHFLTIPLAISGIEAVFEALRATIFAIYFLYSFYFLSHYKKSFDQVARVIVVVAGTQALYGLLQYYGSDPFGLPGGSRPPFGTHANLNQYGSALLFAVPFIGWNLLRGKLEWKVIAGLVLALSLPAMFFSGSRAVWLALMLGFAALVPVVLLTYRKAFRSKAMFWALFGLYLLSGAGLYFAASHVNKKKAGSMNFEYLWRDDVSIKPEHSSMEFRFIVWNRSMDMLAEHPLGVGAGNWKMNIPKYGIKGYDDQGRYGLDFSVRPHNDFLWIATETGWAGLICYLALFVMAFGATFWMVRGGKSPPEKLRGLVILLALWMVLIISFFSFPRERVFQNSMVWLVLAMAFSGARLSKPAGRNMRYLHYAAIPLLLAGLIMTVARTRADRNFRQVRILKDKKQWIQVEKAADKAENWAYLMDPGSGTPVLWYKGMACLMTQRLPQGLEYMRLAQKIAPWNLAVRTNLAGAYEMNGDHDNAAREYESLLKTFPDYEEGWLNLAVVYLNKREKEKCRAALEHVDPNTNDPKYNAIIQALAGL